MSSLRQTWFHGRRALGTILGLVVVIGLLAVFTGTLTRSTDSETRAEQARGEIAVLEARVAAGEQELTFIESDAFVEQQARAFGFGEKGETRFALPPDAPEPPAIVPIGPVDAGGPAKAPFDAWMDLLFGA